SRSRRAAGACRNSHGSSYAQGGEPVCDQRCNAGLNISRIILTYCINRARTGGSGRLQAATRWRVSALLRYRLCEREGCDVMTGRPLVDAQAELGDHGEDVVEDVCLDGLVDRPARVVREHVDLDRHALGCGCELPHEEGHFLVDARVLT